MAIGRALDATEARHLGGMVLPVAVLRERVAQIHAQRLMDRFVYGSVDAGMEQMLLALEANEPDRAVRIGQNVDPDRHPLPVGRADYWMHYGRALASLRRRHEDAVMALRTAEEIFPTKVLRYPRARDTLAVLLRHSRRGSPADQELRGMARRAGLQV